MREKEGHGQPFLHRGVLYEEDEVSLSGEEDLEEMGSGEAEGVTDGRGADGGGEPPYGYVGGEEPFGDGYVGGEDSDGGGVNALAGGVLAFVRRDVSTRDLLKAVQEAYNKAIWRIGLVSLLLSLPALVAILIDVVSKGKDALGDLLLIGIMLPGHNFVFCSYVVGLFWLIPRAFVSFRLGRVSKKEAKTPLLVSVCCFSLLGVVFFLPPVCVWMFFPVLLLYGVFYLVRGLGLWFFQDRVFQSAVYFNCFFLYVLFLFPVVMFFVVIKATN